MPLDSLASCILEGRRYLCEAEPQAFLECVPAFHPSFIPCSSWTGEQRYKLAPGAHTADQFSYTQAQRQCQVRSRSGLHLLSTR